MSLDDELKLSRRLRQLRERLSPSPSQEQLGSALGVSRQQVAQWESPRAPKVPPKIRIEQYALLFAVGQADPGSLLVKARDELTSAEREEYARLHDELLELRSRAVDAGPTRMDDSVGWFWRFDDGRPITIIGSTQPLVVLNRIPEADPRHPDYTKLLRNADGDAEIELYSHLRATNPSAWITRYLSEERIPTGALNGHVVVLGGEAVNLWAKWFAEHMGVPVGTRSSPGESDSFEEDFRSRVFRVRTAPERSVQAAESDHVHEREESGRTSLSPGESTEFRAVFSGTVETRNRSGEVELVPSLQSDVALIARTRNPLNSEATATLIYGLFARGTEGAVQTFSDPMYTPANEGYLVSKSTHPARLQDFWLLLSVLCDRKVGITTTPQLAKDGTVLREWFRGPSS